MTFFDLACIFMTALVTSSIIVTFLLRFAHYKKLYDFPDHTTPNGRRIHLTPIPRLGGIAIVGAFFLTIYLCKAPAFSKIIYGSSIVLFFLGLLDDLKNISATMRLFIQCAVAFFSVIYCDLGLKFITIHQNFIFQIPHSFGILIAVFIITGAINSMNMIDGLDGLASGVGLIGISILSYFLFLQSYSYDEFLLFFTLPVIGSLVGFLKYNTHPSSIFMGDSGSNWLGFMIGIFILIIANSTPVIPFVSILLAFSIPIFDTTHVIILRLINGKNPMQADDQHLHHSLIKLGFTHSQSVGIIYFLMFFFGELGMIPIAFKQYSLWWIPWCGVLILSLLLILLIQFRKTVLSKNILLNLKFYNKKYIKIPFYTFVFLIESCHRYIIYVLLSIAISSILFKVTPTHMLLAFSCLIMFVTLFLKRSCSFFSAIIIVLIVTLIFSLSHSDTISINLIFTQIKLRLIYNFIFLLLFLSSLFLGSIKILGKYFVITPTDILLVLIPLLILMMPDTWKHGYGFRLGIVHGLILFSALRVYSKHSIYPVNGTIYNKHDKIGQHIKASN